MECSEFYQNKNNSVESKEDGKNLQIIWLQKQDIYCQSAGWNELIKVAIGF